MPGVDSVFRINAKISCGSTGLHVRSYQCVTMGTPNYGNDSNANNTWGRIGCGESVVRRVGSQLTGEILSRRCCGARLRNLSAAGA